MTGLFPESCKQLFICHKSRPGGGGRQINTTFKILLQEIYFFRQCNGDCQCLAARLISLQSHLIFSLICNSSKSCVFCHPRSHRASLYVRAHIVSYFQTKILINKRAFDHKKYILGVRRMIIRIRVCKAHQFRPGQFLPACNQ